METDELNLGTLADRAGAFDELMAVWTSIKGLYADFNPVNKMQIKLFIKIMIMKLLNVCRHFSGRTPLEIIHEKLNLELKKVLAVGHASIKEISMDFGFSSQAALNKYVEQKFGMTPVQLKNRLKNGDYGTEV